MGVKFIETEWRVDARAERREGGYRVRTWVVEDIMVMVHSNPSVLVALTVFEVVKMVGFVMCHH